MSTSTVLTTAQREKMKVYATDHLVSRAQELHTNLMINSLETTLGQFELAFLQNASEATLRLIKAECEKKAKDTTRVSLSFCKKPEPDEKVKNSENSENHENPVPRDLTEEDLMKIDPASVEVKVYQDSIPTISHDMTYHYVFIEIV